MGNRVALVGANDDVLEAVGDRAERIDLAGRAVLPGFVDAHFHLLTYCLGREQVHLGGAESLEATLDLVARAANDLPPNAWVLGRGWNHNLWPTRAFPTRDDLDRVVGGRPACLLSHDVHAVWASSAALELAGIRTETADPSDGRIVRDAAGRPTGVLLESATHPVRKLANRPTLDGAVAALRESQRELARVGVTGVHNLEGALAFRALQTLDARGDLELRVVAGLQRETFAGAVAMGARTGFGSERLRIGQLKLFADGALGSGTAALLEPYEDDARDRGIPTLEGDELVDLMRQAQRAGIGVATHAIGDAAVRLVLDAAETVRADDQDHRQILRVEHAQLVHPDDIPRFGRLGVIASMQPLHATTDMKIADRRWGARCRTGYPWRSLLDSGAHLAFGTDCPVEPPDPFKGIHAAVTRQRNGDPPGGWYPQQRITVAEAIHAYTIGSAAAAGLAHEHGSVAPGKFADLVVLAQDPYRIPPDDLADVTVDITIFDGRVIHGR